jgi:hypothetical protein
MGYNIDISVNMVKEKTFSDIETIIVNTAELYGCENIVSISEEDGTIKIPRYHMIFVINFVEDNFENFIKFIKCIKDYKRCYIESIYNNSINKLLYGSSIYLKNIDKEISNKYKKFIYEKKFTPNENIILKEFIKL